MRGHCSRGICASNHGHHCGPWSLWKLRTCKVDDKTQSVPKGLETKSLHVLGQHTMDVLAQKDAKREEFPLCIDVPLRPGWIRSPSHCWGRVFVPYSSHASIFHHHRHRYPWAQSRWHTQICSTTSVGKSQGSRTGLKKEGVRGGRGDAATAKLSSAGPVDSADLSLISVNISCCIVSFTSVITTNISNGSILQEM